MSETALATTNGAPVATRQHSVGALAEQQRAAAEIQAAIVAAKSDRRDEIHAVERIKTMCQRQGLAEIAEYSYSRGGTAISGPTIHLLTAIANQWGNIQFGFRELSQANGESTVEAFAWDLETNSRRVLTFTIKHQRHTKNGSYPLTDPRDVYELVANNAQRRVRSCLEAIIPADIIDDAVKQCQETLKAKADTSPKAVAKLVETFAGLGVTKEQIEKRIQRKLDSIQPAQIIALRKVYQSIKDGMSAAGDWFEVETKTDELRKKMESAGKPKTEAQAPPEDNGIDEPPPSGSMFSGSDAPARERAESR